jgi:hypothetical protein
MNELALRDYFERVARLPQRFGVYDCCTFVVEVLLYGFNRDFRHALRYWDRRSAVTRLRGAGGLREAFTDVLGPEQLISDCPPGTVAYFNNPAFVGILMPDYIAVKGHKVIHRFRIEPHRTGWRTD